jgi:hypothetical protein
MMSSNEKLQRTWKTNASSASSNGVESLLGAEQLHEMQALESEREKRRFAAKERVEMLSKLGDEQFPLFAPRFHTLEGFTRKFNNQDLKEEVENAIPDHFQLCRT